MEAKLPDHILQFFEYAHLPSPRMQSISKAFHDLAHSMTADDNNNVALPRNPERTIALRKLLEAKDAAVRAYIAKA